MIFTLEIPHIGRKSHRDFCKICNSIKSLEIHRIKPREFGGNYELKNIIVVCRPCHIQIHRFINQTRYQENFNEYNWMDYIEMTRQYLEIEKELNVS